MILSKEQCESLRAECDELCSLNLDAHPEDDLLDTIDYLKGGFEEILAMEKEAHHPCAELMQCANIARRALAQQGGKE